VIATSVVYSAGKTTEVVTASGDLNGDDAGDATVLLEDNTSRTARFGFAVVVLNAWDNPTPKSALMISGRIVPGLKVKGFGGALVGWHRAGDRPVEASRLSAVSRLDLLPADQPAGGASWRPGQSALIRRMGRVVGKGEQ